MMNHSLFSSFPKAALDLLRGGEGEHLFRLRPLRYCFLSVRICFFTANKAEGLILKDSRPRPIKRGVNRGSPAISPHILDLDAPFAGLRRSPS